MPLAFTEAVNLDCQLGWICHHLGNRHLEMVMRLFPEFMETPTHTLTVLRTGACSKMNKEEKEEGS